VEKSLKKLGILGFLGFIVSPINPKIPVNLKTIFSKYSI